MLLTLCTRLSACGLMSIYRRRPARFTGAALLSATCAKCRGPLELKSGADRGELDRALRVWATEQGADQGVIAQLLVRFDRAWQRYFERAGIRARAREKLPPETPWYERLKAERRALRSHQRKLRADRQAATRWDRQLAVARADLRSWRDRHDQAPHTTGIRRESQWRDGAR